MEFNAAKTFAWKLTLLFGQIGRVQTGKEFHQYTSAIGQLSKTYKELK